MVEDSRHAAKVGEQLGKDNLGSEKEIRRVSFKADGPIRDGMVCIIAGFNPFDWMSPIQHLIVDNGRLEEMEEYYQSRMMHYQSIDEEKRKGIPAAISAAYDTYLYANGGRNDNDSLQRQKQVYDLLYGFTKLSDFYGKKAMVCGEASIFAHQLISNDLPTQIVFGYLNDEPHAFLLVEMECGGGIGLFDVNNANGELPYFIDFPREVYRRFIESEISMGMEEERMYIFQEGLNRRLFDPLQTSR